MKAVEAVLEDARDRDLIARNAAANKKLQLTAETPDRSYLHPVQIEARFEAARQIEQETRGLSPADVAAIRASSASAVSLARDFGVSDVLIGKLRRGEVTEVGRYGYVPRLALVATLVLGGQRIRELGLLDHHDINLADGYIRRPRLKTDASERSIPMLPALRDVLLEYRATQPPHVPPFATRTGKRFTGDNVRARLRPVRARANALLVARGHEPIARLTPHTFRRTFASILAAAYPRD
ncbi:MAG TPA: site-specific integrase [Thermoleophilaceae bacterium]